jgi:hypothetical protein
MNRSIPLSGHALVASALLVVMAATRGVHLDLGMHLPDFTLAAFALAGLASAGLGTFFALCAGAVLIDVCAVAFGGVSPACFSWAYPFLAPAYACTWLAGRAAARATSRAGAASTLAWALPVGCAASFLVSSGSFYALVARHVPAGQYVAANAGYWVEHTAWTAAYVVAGVAVAALLAQVRGVRVLAAR